MPLYSWKRAAGARQGHDADKAFLRLLEARVTTPDASEEDAIDYLIALALDRRDGPRGECAA